MLGGTKLCLEALSKIPKRFIDEETRYTAWIEQEKVYIANPKYIPMFYCKKKWHFVRFKQEMTASEVICRNLGSGTITYGTPSPVFKKLG